MLSHRKTLLLGLIHDNRMLAERAFYCLPKNEDSRQPQCPEDKESAIVEALKHFKMNS